jgi:hypothetical protein
MSELNTLADVAKAPAAPSQPPASASPPLHQPAPSAPPSASEPPAPRRGAISDSHYAGLPADQQAKYSLVRKGPDGGGEWVARDQLEADPAAAPKPGDPAAQGEKFKFGELELTAAEINELVAHKAQTDLRKLTLPAGPEAYEAKLPADFKMPGGIEYKFDANDPSMVAARNWAHAKGLSQDEFSQVLGIYAAHEAGKEAALRARAQAEIAKAGVSAPQRVDAVGRWLDSFMGTADARPLRATLVTDAHLRFFEKVMTQHTSQGAATFDNRHRDRPDDGRVNDAAWDAMSPAARLDYARQHDQRQFNNPR